MSLLHMDGFDTYSNAQLQGLHGRWVDNDGRIVIGTGRNGSGLQCNTGANNVRAAHTFPSVAQGTAVIIGFAWRKTTNNTDEFLELISEDGAVCHLGLQWNSVTNALQLYRASSGTILASAPASTLPFNTWAYIELKAVIDDAAGIAQVRINGSLVIDFAGDTRNGNTGVVGMLAWRGDSTSWNADDLYVCDGNGAENNDFLGDVKIETLRPNGAGNYAEFTPSAGTNWENVDETTHDSDSTYNASSTVGHRDSFAMTDIATVAGSVKGMQHMFVARKDDAGVREVRPFLRIGGTDYDGSVVNLFDSYTQDRVMRETNPATGVAWTLADLAALEVGYKVET